MAWTGRKYNQGNSNQNQQQDQGGDEPQQQSRGGNNRGNFQKRNSGGGGFKRNSGGGGRKFGRQGGGNNSDFETITALFPSSSGNSHTVFLKPDHIETFQSMQEGDIIGVNPSSKDPERLTFWLKRADNSGQDDNG